MSKSEILFNCIDDAHGDRRCMNSLMHNLLEPLVKAEHEDLHLNVKGYDVGM